MEEKEIRPGNYWCPVCMKLWAIPFIEGVVIAEPMQIFKEKVCPDCEFDICFEADELESIGAIQNN